MNSDVFVQAPRTPRELSWWQQHRLRFHIWWTSFRRRYIPRLVWYGDEIDVCITFTENKLVPIELDPHKPIDMNQIVAPLFRGTLAQVEHQLKDIGIEFDKGLGPDGRDWEWDWSLRGPVHVKFRGRAQNPEQRAGIHTPRHGRS